MYIFNIHYNCKVIRTYRLPNLPYIYYGTTFLIKNKVFFIKKKIKKDIIVIEMIN